MQLPAGPEWSDKLMPRERAGELAGDVPVYFEVTHALRVRCAECDQSCGLFDPVDRFEPVDGEDRSITPDEFLSAVLRHRVMAHNQSLSGTSNG